MFILAVDVEKAYDRVCRDRLQELAYYLGIAANPFWNIMWNATVDGLTRVTGGATLSDGFLTTRGIKQGCPASPIIFGFILSALESYLRAKCDSGIVLHG